MTGELYGNKWATNKDGYPRFRTGPHRDKYVHRVVFEKTASRDVRPGFQVHHQGSKLCFCPHNLIELPEEFNRRSALRCPYTGRFISWNEYRRMVAA